MLEDVFPLSDYSYHKEGFCGTRLWHTSCNHQIFLDLFLIKPCGGDFRLFVDLLAFEEGSLSHLERLAFLLSKFEIWRRKILIVHSHCSFVPFVIWGGDGLILGFQTSFFYHYANFFTIMLIDDTLAPIWVTILL